MGQCTRCSVANLMKKYGKDNTIEIETYSRSSEYAYIIFVKNTNTNKKNVISIKGIKYEWVMGGYSLKHSLDEDCAVSFHPNLSNSGFPIKVSIEDLDVCKINN